MRNPGHYLLVFLKGVAMGAADVVPGVSGGTIAFISGIYLELIDSIKSVNLQAFRMLQRQGVAAAWRHINGNFLFSLVAGIALSLFSLARLTQYLLMSYPLLLWSFFFGLIVGSVIYLIRQHPPGSVANVALFVIGAVLAWGISLAPPVALQGTHLTMFLAGSVALCAMILPGISGSFILVLLGLYPVFIGAIADLKLDILLVFGFGGILGLLLFSRLLSWLLHHYQVAVISTMCGFLLGSLNIIWPWKQVLSTMVSHSGKTIVLASKNLLPGTFAEITQSDPQTLTCLGFMVIGLVLVLSLEYVGERFREHL